MNFLKQIANMFVPRPSTGGDVGLYYYIKCIRCGEVIKVRVNPMNDLSISDEPNRRFTHKTIVGRRCYNRIEADFTYDSNRKLVNTEVSSGEMVTKQDFEKDQSTQPQK